jgi:hypothetical protein
MINPFQPESLQYGLAIADILIPGEDPFAFENLLDQFQLDHKPKTATEVVLIHDLVKFHWLKNRALRMQQKAYLPNGDIDTKLLDQMNRLMNQHHRAFTTTLKTLLAAQSAHRKWEKEDAPPVFTEMVFPKYPGLGRDGYKLVPGVNDHYEDLEDDDEDDDKEPPRVFSRTRGRLS